jgi:hypothetical protein
VRPSARHPERRLPESKDLAAAICAAVMMSHLPRAHASTQGHLESPIGTQSPPARENAAQYLFLQNKPNFPNATTRYRAAVQVYKLLVLLSRHTTEGHY